MEWINKTELLDHFLLVGEKHNVADYMSAMDVANALLGDFSSICFNDMYSSAMSDKI